MFPVRATTAAAEPPYVCDMPWLHRMYVKYLYTYISLGYGKLALPTARKAHKCPIRMWSVRRGAYVRSPQHEFPHLSFRLISLSLYSFAINGILYSAFLFFFFIAF